MMSVSKSVRICAVALGAMLTSVPAHSADLYGGYKDGPVFVPLPSWQGFYVGAHLGGAWSSVDPASNVLILNEGGSLPVSGFGTSGFFGGVQLGYNVQAGNFLYGIEADLGGLDNSASARFTDPNTPSRVLSVTSNGGFYGDITGRGGIILGNTLIYAKGGFAFFTGGVNVTDNHDNIEQNSGTFTGWTIGGGIEYQLNPSWTVKVEYLYFDFNNSNFNSFSDDGYGRVESSITANTVKVGFNYIFHSLQTPLY